MSIFGKREGGQPPAGRELPEPAEDITATGEQTAVLAGGCFWCVEAVFKPLDGVLEATSGYAGGSAETADYYTVCSGSTNHAEAVRVRFDGDRISFGRLLQVFFGVAHDPTQVDRQGPDTGPQYRSAIFYADDEQKRVAEAYIRRLEEAGVFDAPIATTLEPLEGFYEAEGYHQDFFENHPYQPYMVFHARPKLARLESLFGDRLKKR